MPELFNQAGLPAGVGWEYSSLETVLDSLRPSQREDVQKILRTHNVLETDYEWRLFQCEHCRRLYDRLWVKLVYDGDHAYETEYACSECEGSLRQLRDLADIDQIPCSHCGQRMLVIDAPFLWD